MRKVIGGLALVSALAVLAGCSSTSNGGPGREAFVPPIPAPEPTPEPTPQPDPEEPGSPISGDVPEAVPVGPGTMPSLPIGGKNANAVGNSLYLRFGPDPDDGVIVNTDQSGPSSSSVFLKDGVLQVVPNGLYDARAGANERLVSAATDLKPTDTVGLWRNDAGTAEARTFEIGDFFFTSTQVANRQQGHFDYGIGYEARNKTDPAALSNVRSATYTGSGSITVSDVTGMAPIESGTYLGTSTLAANFEAGTVKGGVQVNRPNGDGWRVTLNDGSISGADFAGSTTFASTSATPIAEQAGDYLGSFSGANAASAGGVFAGSVTYNDQAEVRPDVGGLDDRHPGPVGYAGHFVVNRD